MEAGQINYRIPALWIVDFSADTSPNLPSEVETLNDERRRNSTPSWKQDE